MPPLHAISQQNTANPTPSGGSWSTSPTQEGPAFHCIFWSFSTTHVQVVPFGCLKKLQKQRKHDRRFYDPQRFADLIIPAGRAIRAANGTVAIGALANVDVHPDPETPPPHIDPRPGHGSGFLWLQSVLKAGGGAVADVVTVHPCNFTSTVCRCLWSVGLV